MTTIDYGIFDCDTHCYETRDAFTRYLPEEFKDRAITTVRGADGVEVILAGHRAAPSCENAYSLFQEKILSSIGNAYPGLFRTSTASVGPIAAAMVTAPVRKENMTAATVFAVVAVGGRYVHR
ncbi:hypothetical protein A5698_26575 [Mycobacterium sp. E136]|nr:hypothetical protein [Mycobacterium sp. E136]OBG87337.1 hypothetical protein A5698_26575 [Mycobacterium sp. E136]